LEFVLRTDPEARGQSRILVLGLATCLVVYYAASTILLAPLAKKLEAAQARKQELGAVGDQGQLAITGPKIDQLRSQKSAIQEDIAILAMREKLHRRQWLAMGESGRFNQVIFTMNPTAPVNIDKQLTKMNLGETRKFEMFEEQPVSLAGRGSYPEVLAYIRYLEKSPEIGALDNLELKSSREAGEEASKLVYFSLQASRIVLKE
jgi:Tfp pilus assembly protein PilO